jgi:hypothetical protein
MNWFGFTPPTRTTLLGYQIGIASIGNGNFPTTTAADGSKTDHVCYNHPRG